MMRKIIVLILITTALSTSIFAQADSIAKIFSNTEVKVILPKDLFLSGTKVEAEIFLVEHDSAKKATAFVEGWREMKMEGGKAKYTTIAMGEGTKTIEGYVDYYIGDKYRRYAFRKDYTVHKGAATIEASRMNVLYKGIENPIYISVPGFPPEKVMVTIANGKIVKINDFEYIATVYKSGEAKISVAVKMGNNYKQMASTTFKIKYPPRLQTKLATIHNGEELEAETLKDKVNNLPRVFIGVDESFPYESLKFSVGSYRFSLYKANGTNPTLIEVEGQELTPEVLELIKTIEKGDKIIIDNIIPTAPDEAWGTSPYVITAK